MEKKTLPKTELMKVEDVATILQTTPRKVTAAIRNGTMPIGAVGDEDRDDKRVRTIIIKQRFERWIAGADLGN